MRSLGAIYISKRLVKQSFMMSVSEELSVYIHQTYFEPIEQRWGLVLKHRVPFLDKEFLNYAMSIHPKHKSD